MEIREVLERAVWNLGIKSVTEVATFLGGWLQENDLKGNSGVLFCFSVILVVFTLCLGS